MMPDSEALSPASQAPSTHDCGVTKSRGVRSTIVFTSAIAVLAILRLALVSQLPIHRMRFDVDDMLYMRHARWLASFDWLGPYDFRLLTKAPGYGMFLAGSALLGLTRPLAEELLLVVAAGHFATTLRRLGLNAVFAILVFAAIVFNPGLLVGTLQRTVREGIYGSQCLLVVSLAARLMTNVRTSRRVLSAVLLGVVSSWTAVTREEWHWLLAPLVPLFFGIHRSSSGARVQAMVRTLAYAGIVVVLVGGTIFGIRKMNERRYGIGVVSELDEPHFNEAVAAFQRVADIHPMRYEPCDMNELRTLAKESPLLAQVMPMIDSPAFRQPMMLAENGERQCNFLSWTLRTSAANAGWFTSGKTAAERFHALTEEMNAAMDRGVIKAGPRRSNAMPYPRSAQWSFLARSFVDHAKDIVRMNFKWIDVLRAQPMIDAVSKDEAEFFDVIGAPPIASQISTARSIQWIGRVTEAQKRAYPWILALSLFVLVARGALGRWIFTAPLTFVGISLALAFLARTAIVAYLETYCFSGATQYLTPFYSWPIALALIVIGSGIGKRTQAPT